LHLVGSGRSALEISSEDPVVVRAAYAAMSRALGGAGALEVRLFEPARGRPHPRFVVRAQGELGALLRTAGVVDVAGRPAEPARRLAPNRCDAGAFLRGAFLVRGTVSEPRHGAHLEVRLPSAPDAAFAVALLERIDVRASVRTHKAAAVVTVKDVAGVGRCLAAMGAHGSYLAWEEGTVWKSVRGEANRLANCDTANARRIVGAALAQRFHIEALDASGTLARLPSALREAARLRLEHPQAPLDELARLSRPPVTKAAMADRFRRLGRHAEALVG
jgi:DNA-binding protein WhiA